MNRMHARARALGAAVLLALLALSACNSDDNPGSPKLPGTPTDDPYAAMGLAVMEFGAEVTTMLPAWWNGDLSGITKSPPTWNAQTMSWQFSVEAFDPDVTYPSYAGVLAYFQLQYLAGETPQQEAEGADRMVLTANIGAQRNIFVDENENSTISFYTDVVVTVTEESPGTLRFAGGGQGDLQAYVTEGGEFSELQVDGIDVDWQLTLPTGGGCPTGTFAMAHGGDSLVVTFAGSGTAAWVYTLGGQGSTSGNAAVDCGS